MSEAYLIAANQGSLNPFSSQPHAEQIRPVLQELFEKSGCAPRRVRQLHWHGGDQEFWLASLGQTFGFAPDLARYQWPSLPLLAHSSLQGIARTIEAGDTDLVLLAQETGDQLVVLLLASPSAVGLYNLSPRACLRHKLAVSGAPGGLLQAARAALQKASQKPAEEDPAGEGESKRETITVQWLAAARRMGAAQDAAFPGARWVTPSAEIPPGDLFLLHALVKRLEEEKEQYGLLISEGPYRSGQATLLERI